MSSSKIREYFQSLHIKSGGFIYFSLLSFYVTEIVKSVNMRWAKSESIVVAFLRLVDKALFFESISKIAVGIRKIGLKLYGTPVRLYS